MALPLCLEAVRSRPSMYLADASYNSIAACIQGYDLATAGVFLDGFREWLIPQLDGGNNLIWPVLVMRLAIPGSNVTEKWSPDHDQRAVDTLFDKLSSFLAAREQPHGKREIMNTYNRWLQSQSWHHGSGPVEVD